VKYLLENGADINQKNKWNGETPLFKACESGNRNLVEYLRVEQSANINKKK